jgi:hypothetical protein
MTSEELLMKYENQWVFLSKEMIDYMLDENTQQLPQQEISDEEIEESARKYTFDEYQKVIHYENYDTYNDFVNGAKWYREQLKQRQCNL